jgi:tetratricopeptide (TPR) repeat protein
MPAITIVATLAMVAVAAAETPAERQIAEAQKAIAKSATADGYNHLALAYARRARESSDVDYYRRADEAVDASLRVAPDNLEALKMRTWILLGRHEFGPALTLAKQLNAKNADDLLIYGFLTDANVELGNYRDAEEACQWMLDLRPGNIPAFTRAAYLREMFGDIEGAVELMNAAYDRTPATEVEDRAWILTQVAHLALVAGRVADAEQVAAEALRLFPGYHYALGTLAQVRTAQKRYADAVMLLRQRADAAPHAENLYALGEALMQAGHTKDAAAAFAQFEAKARAEMTLADNANRELIYYYADHAKRPAEALRIAEQEMARRHDVYTRAAYAWALHVNGRDAEARKQIDEALAVGVKDPLIVEHAKAIRRQRGQA